MAQPSGDFDMPIGIQCNVDPSMNMETAYELTLGEEHTETFCPRLDEDYWKVMVTGERQLLQVDVTFQKLSSMRLGLDWWGPDGVCLPTGAAGCGMPADCNQTGGETCDMQRGVCRPNGADQCLVATDCTDGTACDVAILSKPPVVEANANGSLHRIKTNLPAFVAGNYTFKIHDRNNAEEDAETLYHLTVAQVQDLDTHEPNDTDNLATLVTSAIEVQGYFSYDGDVDWYRIAPELATQAVVNVNLAWPFGSAISPTWTLYQGDWAYESLGARDDNTGAVSLRRRQSQVLTPSSEPIYIKISNTVETVDDANAYTLTVSTLEDPQEGAARNDAPGLVPVGSDSHFDASDANPTKTFEDSIIAANDQDWYRVDSSHAENALLYFELSSTSDDYLLQLTVHKANGNSCDALGNCAGAARCVDGDNICIEPWVQRPSPDGPGDPQLGGLTPNFIKTQLPNFGSGPRTYYVLVSHNASTTLDVKGFTDLPAVTYDLTIEHRVEPDAEDATNPDNNFFARPMQAENPGLATFSDHYRDVGGSFTPSGPAGSGTWFATMRVAGAIAPYVTTPSACLTLTVEVYDDFGEARPASTDVTLTDSGGGLFYQEGDTACEGSAAPAPGPYPDGQLSALRTITGGSGDICCYRFAGAENGDHTVRLEAAGGSAIEQAFPATQSATPNVITFSAIDGDAAPRGFAIDDAAIGLRANLVQAPSGAAQPFDGTILFSPTTPQTASVACASGIGCPSTAGTDPCPDNINDADGPCNAALTAQTEYGVRLLADGSPGPVALQVSDQASNVLPATWVMAAFTPKQVVPNDIDTTWIQGYISYEGDQDFFAIPVDPIPDAGLTVRLKMAPSNVDIRLQTYRNGRGVAPAGLTNGDDDAVGVNTTDLCLSNSCPNGATCDDRQLCSQPAINDERGVGNGECALALESGEIRIWVNDITYNDWDLLVPYEFQVEITEGCPAVCDNTDLMVPNGYPGYTCSP